MSYIKVLLLCVMMMVMFSCAQENNIIKYGIDVIMLPKTWNFDSVSVVRQSENVYSLDGLYYYGSNAPIFKRSGQQVEGQFSCGSYWISNNMLILSGQFDNKLLKESRRLAGRSFKGQNNCISFNTFGPGTCYVIFKPHESAKIRRNNKVHLFFQEKGLNTEWCVSSSSAPLINRTQELKLQVNSSGSFWLASPEPIVISSIRFVPKESEIIPLELHYQTPQYIRRRSDGVYFADFRRDAFGQIEVILTSNNESNTITMRLGECLKGVKIDTNPGGARRYKSFEVPLIKGTHTYKPELLWDVYSSKQDAIYMPMEIGDVMPFRYCEIEGYEGELTENNIKRCVVHHRFNDNASYFHCSDDSINKIWDFCKYSIKTTSFTGYYVDGDRERRPYEADALINQLSHYAVDSDYKMAQRTIEYLLKNPTWPTEWIMQTILMVWNDYIYSGNKELIQKYHELLRAHTLLSFVDSNTGLVTTTKKQSVAMLKAINCSEALKDIVDYPHASDEQKGEDDNFDFTDYNTVVNAFHYMSCLRMSQIYGVLKMETQQHEMEKYCENFRKIFHRSFFDEERQIYRDGLKSNHSSLHSNVFALCFGLVPYAYKQTVIDFIISKGMACSVYGAQFLLEALFEAGCADAALELIRNTDTRGWLNMMREGATVTTESWSNGLKPNQDWNHAWGTAPANIIPFRLLGVRPLSPGFSRCEIRPQIVSLRNVECKVPTMHGSIHIVITQSEKSYVMQVDIPEGIKSEIYLPVKSSIAYNVLLDNKKLIDYSVEKETVKINNPLTGFHTIRIDKVLVDKK